MFLTTNRRKALQTFGVGLAASVGGIAGVARAATGEPSLAPHGAGTLEELTAQVAKAPRRRSFKTVQMILTQPDQWDSEALNAILHYRGGPKQVWNNTDIHGPWLNVMRNSMNAEIWSFRHPDFLCVSDTHGAAQYALYDDSIWEKYQLAKRAGHGIKSNTFLHETPAGLKSPQAFNAPDGPFSPDANSIPTLERRGAIFLACHNAIWELAGALLKTTNPDHLSHEALAAELTNHVIPSVVVTPGAVGTLVELERAGFTYAR